MFLDLSRKHMFYPSQQQPNNTVIIIFKSNRYNITVLMTPEPWLRRMSSKVIHNNYNFWFHINISPSDVRLSGRKHITLWSVLNHSWLSAVHASRQPFQEVYVMCNVRYDPDIRLADGAYSSIYYLQQFSS